MSAPFTPPPVVGEYRLVRQLGQGTMGQVWLAQDTMLERPVAIKFVHALGAGEARVRFSVEARAIARLAHPNVVAVHHAGEVDGCPYLVTELLEGAGLDRLPKPVDPEVALAIGIEMARGLAAAHRAGVLHRDVKPANAFRCASGRVKLLDFGLAKLGTERDEREALADTSQSPGVTPGATPAPPGVSQSTIATGDGRVMSGEASEDTAHAPLALAAASPGDTLDSPVANTVAGAIAGTPLYMAPERWRGQPATRRTDVYSLGAVLYELLTGHAPHGGKRLIELREAVLGRHPPALREENPRVPESLAWVIERCLRIDPAERPASADEVREKLEALAEELGPAVGVAPGGDHGGDVGGNPYRGLLAFGAAHRALFRGRDAEVRAVVAELRAHSLVVIAGPSGAGKSSLARAGVLARVDSGGLDGHRWRTALLVPGRRPLEALAAAIAPLLGPTPGPPGATPGVTPGVIDEATALARLAADPAWAGAELRASAGAHGRVLLLVDQLEEIITTASPAEREPFARALGELADSAPAVRVLATLRSDFLGRLGELGELAARLVRATWVLGPMSRAALRQAIVEPAARRGYRFESEELVERLVDSASHGAGALPLLQFALSALWNERDEAQKQLGAAALDRLGGIEGALAAHANAVLRRLPAAHRDEARRLLLALVTAEGTRARRPAAELAGDTPPPERAAALEALVEGRLVVAAEGEHGATYEVAHEALVGGWPALRGWLAEEASARDVEDRLRRAAGEWERAGRPADALWRGRQLAELAALDGRSLAAREREFAAACRGEARRASVRRWGLRAGIPVALAGIVIASLATWRASERRDAAGFVAMRLREAAAVEADLSRLMDDAAAARRAAFARFDERDSAGGERAWAAARDLTARAHARFGEASSLCDAALARDRGSGEARARAADLVYRWLLFAEDSGDDELAAELARRLATLDDGTRGALLAAPARVSVATRPPGARVTLFHVALRPSGHLVEGEARSLPEGGVITTLAPGSYVIEARAPDRVETRLPIALARGQELRVTLDLPAAAEVPAGFLYVPAGQGPFGAADADAPRLMLETQPEHPVATAAFLIARDETTYAAYLEYLAELPVAEREARRPDGTGVSLALGPTPVLTLGAASAPLGQPLCRPARTVRACQDWRQLPVTGVSWADATAYAAWLAATGRVPGARLCREHEWERAARGADGRPFATGGMRLASGVPGDANHEATYGSDPAQMGADAVGSYAADISPFGVRDLIGNVREWVSDPVDREIHDNRVARGAAWDLRWETYARASNRRRGPDTRTDSIGIRLCASLGPR